MLDVVKESELQAAVVELAGWLGWRCYHTFDSRHSAAGFPDLVLVHPRHGILYAELKTDRGRLSPAQDEWIAALQDAGGHVAVFLERDWHSGLIEEVLRGGS